MTSTEDSLCVIVNKSCMCQTFALMRNVDDYCTTMTRREKEDGEGVGGGQIKRKDKEVNTFQTGRNVNHKAVWNYVWRRRPQNKGLPTDTSV